MAIKVGEIGKIIDLDAQFDLSANTDIKLLFTKPDASTLEVTKAGGVSAPNIASDVGFLAGEYWQYAVSTGDIDQAGAWFVRGEYIDGTPKTFFGNTATFTVLPAS